MQVVNGYCGLIALCKNSLKVAFGCMSLFIVIHVISCFLKDGHTVYPINSQISSKLWHAEAVESMMSYFKRYHLFKFSYWLVPVHLGAHWAMMVNKLMRNFMCRKQVQNIPHEVYACLKCIV